MRTIFSSLLIFLLSFGIISAKDYNRIVSLAPSITNSIYALGAQDKLVGCTNYCKEAIADKKPVVASVMKINTEMLVSVKPDLVIATDFTNAKDISTIEKFGIEVKKVSNAHSYDEICSQFKDLGVLVGKSNEADKIINDSRKRVNKIVQASRKNKPVSVFFQIGADPLYTVIPNTFMNDYIRFINGINIASLLTKGRIGREFVLKANPDYLFIVTMGIVGEKEEKEWRKFANIKAVRNNHIYIVDSSIACVPTPFSFAEALEYIYKCINSKK